MVAGRSFLWLHFMLLIITIAYLYRRSKHTVVAYRDAIYVFGGDNGYVVSNYDCHVVFILISPLQRMSFYPPIGRICWMTYSALTWRTAHGAGKQCNINEKNLKFRSLFNHLCLIFTTEPSPLEPHLPQDITIRLSSMEAACLFLVTFLGLGSTW